MSTFTKEGADSVSDRATSNSTASSRAWPDAVQRGQLGLRCGPARCCHAGGDPELAGHRDAPGSRPVKQGPGECRSSRRPVRHLPPGQIAGPPRRLRPSGPATARRRPGPRPRARRTTAGRHRCCPAERSRSARWPSGRSTFAPWAARVIDHRTGGGKEIVVNHPGTGFPDSSEASRRRS